jgi:hypothetical protein
MLSRNCLAILNLLLRGCVLSLLEKVVVAPFLGALESHGEVWQTAGAGKKGRCSVGEG